MEAAGYHAVTLYFLAIGSDNKYSWIIIEH